MMHTDIWGKEHSRQWGNIKYKDAEMDLCVARSLKCQMTGAEQGRQSIIKDHRSHGGPDHGAPCSPEQRLEEVGSQ